MPKLESPTLIRRQLQQENLDDALMRLSFNSKEKAGAQFKKNVLLHVDEVLYIFASFKKFQSSPVSAFDNDWFIYLFPVHQTVNHYNHTYIHM